MTWRKPLRFAENLGLPDLIAGKGSKTSVRLLQLYNPRAKQKTPCVVPSKGLTLYSLSKVIGRSRTRLPVA